MILNFNPERSWVVANKEKTGSFSIIRLDSTVFLDLK